MFIKTTARTYKLYINVYISKIYIKRFLQKQPQSTEKKQLSRCHVDPTLNLSSSKTSVSYVETHV